ncbi:MAG: hypothetical protein KDK39_03050 [Leptospiraceae bacterium]|nr:hypothetical protein [Leptospiraceae bacterium]
MNKLIIPIFVMLFLSCHNKYNNDSKAITYSALVSMETGVSAGIRYFEFKKTYPTQVGFIDIEELSFLCDDHFFETKHKSKWYLTINEGANINVKRFKYGELITKKGKVEVLKPLVSGRWYYLKILGSNGYFRFWFKHEDKTITLSNTDGQPAELLQMERDCESSQ